MRICIFSAQFAPVVGGVERYTEELGKALVGLGHQVVVATSSQPELPFCVEKDGLKVYRLPSHQLMGGRLPVVRGRRAVRDVVAQLEAEQCDAVVVNARFYPLCLFGVRFAARLGLPVILIEHGSGHVRFGNPVVNWAGERYEHWLTRREMRYCDAFYGVSQACCEWLRHFSIEARGVLYNAVDVEQLETLAARPAEDYRALMRAAGGSASDGAESKPATTTGTRAVGAPPDATVPQLISFVGRLAVGKGVEATLQAFAQLRAEGSNDWLLIAGDGLLQDEVVRAAEADPHIIYLGRLDYPRTIALLSQSSIYCLPTSYPEGLPTTVLEAVALKTYVITSASGGSKELLNTASMGTILQDCSAQSLTQALRAALANPRTRQEATAQAYTRLKEGFTWQHTAQTLLHALQAPHNGE